MLHSLIMSTPETPAIKRIRGLKPRQISFTESPSIDTASTISSPTTVIVSHELDALNTLLCTQPAVVHSLIRDELQNLSPHAAIEQVCAGVMRQRLKMKTVYQMFRGDVTLAKTLVVRWCDTFNIIRDVINVEKLTLSPVVMTILGLAAFSLMSINTGKRRRVFNIPRMARECGEWIVTEVDFV
jgi:hypothetical protein